MATIRDVAKKAGVSISTVSAVLRGNKNVRPSLRAHVETAARELSYNLPARGKNRKMLGVILPAMTSPFFSSVLKGAEDKAAQFDSSLLLFDTDMSLQSEEQSLEFLMRQDIDGLILGSVCSQDEQETHFAKIAARFCEKRRIPVVLLERNVQSPLMSCIYLEYYKAFYQLINSLIQSGHRKIAHIASKYDIPCWTDRTRAYKDALRDSSIDVDEFLISYGDLSSMSGYIATHSLLRTNQSFTALAAANDQMALGAIKSLKQAGFQIPKDVAVVGFDNINISSMIDPALTTVSVPAYKIGYMAARMILEASEDNTTQRICLDSKLIVRTSTDPFALGEWELISW